MLTNTDFAALDRMAAAAVAGLTTDEFLELTSEGADDRLHADVFGEALQLARFEDAAAADISDALHEGISDAYWSRRDQLVADGLA